MSAITPATPISEAETLEAKDERPEVGSWWWVKAHASDDEEELDVGSDFSEVEAKADYDRGRGKSRQWLGAVVDVGSNYVKLKGLKWSRRIALDDMAEECVFEPEPHKFINSKIDRHRDRVRELMGEIRRVCAQLGVPYHEALAAAEGASSALTVLNGTENVKTYEKALVKAKDKTLPELFEKVKAQHKAMAVWMRAELIPAEAELERAKGITKAIEHKIHTVELYAGLEEKLVQIRDGQPADASAKVHLLQRRCYMDEECLARYEAGGMDFEDIGDFDKWLARPENFTRILPYDRTIVAFRIRRTDKEYREDGESESISDFITFHFWNKENKRTYLYIRNGAQLWRMNTSLEFGSQLFSRREDADLIGDDEIWVKSDGLDADKFISGREYEYRVESWRKERSETAKKLILWKRAGKPDEDTYWICDPSKDDVDPWRSTETPGYPVGVNLSFRECGRPLGSEHISNDWENYSKVTPESIYYDDAMKEIASANFEHNKIAIIIQGLLDRSTCLHPHPPWRIWTPEGFAAGIELRYDSQMVLVDKPELKWEQYRAQLNKNMGAGSVVVNPWRSWRRYMHAKYGERYNSYARGRDRHDRWPKKYGDGPETIDTIQAVRAGKAKFVYERKRSRAVMVPARPGYVKRSYPKITAAWWCDLSELTRIDSYTPGDFRMFFDDPRTRAQYLKWAPVLLTAENWHAARVTAPDVEVNELGNPGIVYEPCETCGEQIEITVSGNGRSWSHSCHETCTKCGKRYPIDRRSYGHSYSHSCQVGDDPPEQEEEED